MHLSHEISRRKVRTTWGSTKGSRAAATETQTHGRRGGKTVAADPEAAREKVCVCGGTVLRWRERACMPSFVSCVWVSCCSWPASPTQPGGFAAQRHPVLEFPVPLSLSQTLWYNGHIHRDNKQKHTLAPRGNRLLLTTCWVQKTKNKKENTSLLADWLWSLRALSPLPLAPFQEKMCHQYKYL